MGIAFHLLSADDHLMVLKDSQVEEVTICANGPMNQWSRLEAGTACSTWSMEVQALGGGRPAFILSVGTAANNNPRW